MFYKADPVTTRSQHKRENFYYISDTEKIMISPPYSIDKLDEMKKERSDLKSELDGLTAAHRQNGK